MRTLIAIGILLLAGTPPASANVDQAILILAPSGTAEWNAAIRTDGEGERAEADGVGPGDTDARHDRGGSRAPGETRRCGGDCGSVLPVHGTFSRVGDRISGAAQARIVAGERSAIQRSDPRPGARDQSQSIRGSDPARGIWR